MLQSESYQKNGQAYKSLIEASAKVKEATAKRM